MSSYSKPIHIKSITELHRLFGFASPLHPLISVLNYAEMNAAPGSSAVFDFYSISIKRNVDMLLYGQQAYDFDEGVLGCIGPKQVLRTPVQPQNPNRTGWIMFFHPDLLYGTPLAAKIREYDFFGYNVNEGLFLSEREEAMVSSIMQNIQHESSNNIDKFSQDVIVAQLELLCTYTQRFYERQFITRKQTSSNVLSKLEDELSAYFDSEDLITKGLPSVQYLSDKLNLSDKYLSSLLKQLTGQSTQQHIHTKLIEKAKEKLSTTDLSVSEVAYALGFQHSQSFSKLFKSKTHQTPQQFRASFN